MVFLLFLKRIDHEIRRIDLDEGIFIHELKGLLELGDDRVELVIRDNDGEPGKVPQLFPVKKGFPENLGYIGGLFLLRGHNNFLHRPETDLWCQIG